MTARATTRHERAAYFPAGGERLLGILTRPTSEPTGNAVVMVAAGGYHTSAHINRLSVLLCRRAAEAGHHGLRFDYHGLGESTGDLSEYRFAEPFVDDLEGAFGWGRAEGVRGFVPVGLCFGARTAISVAREDRSVTGLVHVSLPLLDLRQGEGTAARRAEDLGFWRFLGVGFRSDVLRKFFPPYSFRRQSRVAWAHVRVGVRTTAERVRRLFRAGSASPRSVSSQLLRDLEVLVSRGVPMLFIYGEDDPFYRQFREAAAGPLAPILRRAGSRVAVATVPGEVRPYESVAGQDRLVAEVEAWLAAHVSDPSGRPHAAAAS